ncbi:MAG: beta-galactosidase [Planctomycetota bacterium]|jgi:hypothetical protein
MGTVSLESGYLSVDGSRRWLVGGVIDPSRVPREMWGEALEAARDCGLNSVCVPVVWSRHESTSGRVDFDGERDIAAFVGEARARDLMVVLRPGPFVGDGHDRGGIPSWIEERDGLVLRSSHPEFLRACSSWYASLLSHLKGMMATDGGPIVLVQCEHRWFCGDGQEAKAYLGELTRFLREHGVRVPIVGSHNLFASVEGTIDAWSGHEDLFPTIRQLRAVRPDQPAFVMDLGLGRPGVWGEKPRRAMHGEDVVSTLSSVVAGGGQYQLGSFVGGVHFGFGAGRLAFERDSYLTSSADSGGVVDSTGARGVVYHAARRVSSFVGGFEGVISSLDRGAPVVVRPGGGEISIVSRAGDLGDVTWIFADSIASRKREVELTLGDGRCACVDMHGISCAWITQDVQLDEQTRLDLCTMSVVAYRAGVLVVVAPEGSRGSVVINGTEKEIKTRRGAIPCASEHEGVRVLACTPEQFERVQMGEDGVYVGATRFDAQRAPIAARQQDGVILHNASGEERLEASVVMRAPATPRISRWEGSGCDVYVDGSSPRYARIAGPTAMEDLGTPFGYGWYRVSVRSASARKVRAAWYGSGDRLHVWRGGTLAGVICRGPDVSQTHLALPLKKGQNEIAVLADNLGRASGGVYAGVRRGVWDHIWVVKPIAGLKPTLEIGEPISPMVFRKPITRLYDDDMTLPERPTWEITWRKKSPIAMTLDVSGLGESSGLVMVNGEPVHCFSDNGLDHLVLRDLRRGKNVVQLALIGESKGLLARASGAVRFEECVECLSEDAQWSFAAWELPAASAFAEWKKQQRASRKGLPTWWRGSLALGRVDRPLVLKASGLSKGQLLVNGRNLCRYFVATASGESVAGQQEYVVPSSWLVAEGENEIVLFDEHGFDPSKVTLRWA